MILSVHACAVKKTPFMLMRGSIDGWGIGTHPRKIPPALLKAELAHKMLTVREHIGGNRLGVSWKWA